MYIVIKSTISLFKLLVIDKIGSILEKFILSLYLLSFVKSPISLV